MADMAWMTARIGYRNQIPRYTEIVNRRSDPTDNRSATQIIEDLKTKFGGE